MYAIRSYYDYGRAMKELAATNIFPGDLFLKNFGVTRHGRVVFYDYDELCLLTECNFRKIPKSRGYDDDRITSYNVCYTKLLRDAENRHRINLLKKLLENM